MTSNHRAHQRQAIIRTVHFLAEEMWSDFKWLLRHFKPKQWMWVYRHRLYDIQIEAHEAEIRDARKCLTADDLILEAARDGRVWNGEVFDEIPF